MVQSLSSMNSFLVISITPIISKALNAGSSFPLPYARAGGSGTGVKGFPLSSDFHAWRKIKVGQLLSFLF